ncbi:hypothetical protein BTVI_98249 [Pitangus sulphuratus]|nr:hypothetical protein BTVI_98249 [Pitangus sulphuratus]
MGNGEWKRAGREGGQQEQDKEDNRWPVTTPTSEFSLQNEVHGTDGKGNLQANCGPIKALIQLSAPRYIVTPTAASQANPVQGSNTTAFASGTGCKTASVFESDVFA